MIKTFITCILVFIVIYPPNYSRADYRHTVKESVINYLKVKTEVLKYQINKQLDEVNHLCDSITIKK